MESAGHLLSRWIRAIGPAEVLDALGALLPDLAVFAVDANRDVVYWSPGAERLLGFTRVAMVGQHCLKGNRCQQCMTQCGVAVHGEVNDVPLTLYREDGTTARVRKFAKAFFEPDGRFAGAVEVLVPEGSAKAELAAAEPAPPPVEGAVEFHGLVTRDPAMLNAFQIVRNVAETEANVLVRGESGTGKELVARAIHDESLRRSGPFLAINCASLSPTLLESELFGHVRGAFTGAVRDRPGLFQQADGGTLFLDEVGELPLELQARLLRVIQERSFIPVGGDAPMKVDVRFVAATHRALRQEVKAGRFREDLLYRLRVVPIFLPPLRERRGDVELLLWRFIADHSRRGPRQITRVAPEAMRALLDHDWPGNVRELQNVVQYAFAVGRGPELRIEDLPPELREAGGVVARPVVAAPPSSDEAGRVREALERAGGNISEAAQMLGLSRTTFWRLRQRLGL